MEKKPIKNRRAKRACSSATEVLIREMGLLKSELSRANHELEKLREENQTLAEEVRLIRENTCVLLTEMSKVREDNIKEKQALGKIREENKEQLEKLNIICERSKEQLKELRELRQESLDSSWDNYRPGHLAENYVYLSSIPADRYPEELCKWYYHRTGETLNLANPRTVNEKIQWLKLYDATPLKTRLADKYLVREWVKEKIGEEHLIPLLGVWDSFDEIDFDSLPDQFVLKANHGSGWNIIVKDKTQFDREEAKKKFDVWLRSNFAFRVGLELQYMNIPPKIIAEQYMENINQLVDYKVWCSNGKARFIWVDTDRYTAHKRTLFSLEWEKLPITLGPYSADERGIPKPRNLEKMIRFAEMMCKEFALVRIDFYEVEDRLYFGEMTFTSTSGLNRTDPRSFEYEMGSWITLPPKSEIPTRLF